MSFHIISIVCPKCFLYCKHDQLICDVDGEARKQLPLEDIAAIVINSYAATLHSHLLLQAAKLGVVLVICQDFKPVSLLLPANRSSDTILTKAIFKLGERTMQRLWQKTVNAKCANQYAVAAYIAPDNNRLPALKGVLGRQVKTKEAQVAQYYWKIFGGAIYQSGFRRDAKEAGINQALNYGYSVLLSVVTQKLLALGLDPTVGISHSIRERATPLAYDLMEPFRPCVDFFVYNWLKTHGDGDIDLMRNLEFRRAITQCLLAKVTYEKKTVQLQYCVEMVLRSFRRAVLENASKPYRPWTSSTISKWDG